MTGRRLGELGEVGEDDWTDELMTEAAQLEERHNEIDEMADGLVVYAEEDCARAICIVTIGDNGDSLSTMVSSTDSAPRPRKQPFGSATAGYRVGSRIAAKPIGAIHVFVAGHSTRGTGIVAAWMRAKRLIDSSRIRTTSRLPWTPAQRHL